MPANQTSRERTIERFNIAVKWLLSFRKSEWDLADYPIRIRKQEPNEFPDNSRWKFKPYVATILQWRISGLGDSIEESLSELSKNYEAEKQRRIKEGWSIPRPGSQVPLQLASTTCIDAHADLALDFIHKVLDFKGAWISDDSSLWDFHGEENNDEHYAKIREVYGIDVSDIESGNICEILTRIASSQGTAEKHLDNEV